MSNELEPNSLGRPVRSAGETDSADRAVDRSSNRAVSVPETALVSVGVPVRNGEATVGEAIRSVLAQTYRQLEVVVSDNASTDGTSAVCRSLARLDTRVRYMRQQEDRGAAANFRAVLDAANGEYFMWIGSDDQIDPGFIEANLNGLRQFSDCVLSISQVRWADGSKAAGTFPLTGALGAKVEQYLQHARDNSRFYGLWRRDVLAASYPSSDFYAMDLAVVIGSLPYGDHREISSCLMTRGRTQPESYPSTVSELNHAWFDRLFPMLPLTRFVLRDAGIRIRPRLLWLLAIRNVYEHLRYVSHEFGRFGVVHRVILSAADGSRARIVTDAAHR